MDSGSLDRIAEEYSELVRAGTAPPVDDFVARYPNAPAQLRSLLTSIAMIEGLKSDPPAPDSRSPGIDRLDDYRIVREIGRGGMGIVFEAVHQSLGRRVAIKVLSSGLLGDQKHLARFKREARAAAKLRHTNIVPVFGVGETSEHHYYVMDYIDGQTLGQIIDQKHSTSPASAATIDITESNTQSIHNGAIGVEAKQEADFQDDYSDPRWAARIGAAICDAIHYAHTQGVLHRDIKPANLIVDRTGTVWVADFGLAKLAEQQAVTATGDIMGTPQYMPPESFEGTFDVRSEIYAFGLTLYEMLTRRAAVTGKSPADVIRQATSAVIAKPSSHRPDLPRDLETIVLKCLAHDPNSRYQIAAAVRDDLNRYLANRPIAARRTGLFGRMVRWSRREPIVATLTSATFGLLLALAGVSVVAYLRTSGALDVASAAKRTAEASLSERTDALDAAKKQRQRAERNLQLALAGFDSIMQNISNRGIEAESEFFGEVTDITSPNVTPEDAKLLQTLLGFFDELGTNNSEDLLAESAIAARRAGEIYQRLGQLQQAERAYSEAINRYRKLARRHHDQVEFVLAQCEILNERSVIAGLRGQLPLALKTIHQCLDLIDESDAAMKSESGQFQFARAHRLHASIRARSGIDNLRRLPPARRMQLERRGAGKYRVQRIEDERRSIETAIETLTRLADQSPDQPRYQVELARAYRDRAKTAGANRNKRESEQAIAKSIELFESLADQYQESEAIRYELAVTLSSSEAFGINPLRRAVKAEQLSGQLLRESPDQPSFLALRAHTLTVLATYQARNRKTDQAAQNIDQAIQIYESLAEKSPELSLYVTRGSQAMESKADMLHRRGDTESAIETLQVAIERLQDQANQPKVSPVAQIQLQRLRQKLARFKKDV